MPRPPLARPWRIAASGLAAALLLSFLVGFTPGGRAAASQFLAQFRGEQLAVVEVSPQSQLELQRTFASLGRIGTVHSPRLAGPGGAQPARALTPAEASQQLGFPVALPDPATLPAGVEPTPAIRVVPGGDWRFRFEQAKARAYFESIGHPEVELPDRFDGATVVVSMPAAALIEYPSRSAEERASLIVGEAGQVTVGVEGQVTLEELRDVLLELPGLPAETAAQLRGIKNWQSTLPIPIPSDRVQWQRTTIAGSPGLLLNDNSGIGSAAIWQAGGHSYGVAGALKAAQLQRVANSIPPAGR